jgi:hypothetical protein
MRKLLWVSFFVAGLLICFNAIATACGDKLLVLGRGVKFGNLGSAYHASIIAYVPESVSQSAPVKDLRFQADLQKAGHIMSLVEQEDVLTAAVQSGKYDIILVDMRNVGMVSKQVTNAAVHTVVIPVVYEGAEMKSNAPAEYVCVRKPASGKNNSCLSTINKAFESKLKRDEQQRRAKRG